MASANTLDVNNSKTSPLKTFPQKKKLHRSAYILNPIRFYNFPALLNKVALQHKTIYSNILKLFEKLLGHCDPKQIKYARNF